MVIITDGESDDRAATVIEANNVKSNDIKIVGMVVAPTTTSMGYLEMTSIANTPDEVLALWSTDFSVIQSKLVAALQFSCTAGPPKGDFLDWWWERENKNILK